jgi:transposase InsO family protein
MRPVSRKRIAASMRRQRLVAARPKRFRGTTEADPSKVPAPNLLQRNFHRDRPNKAWVGDITAIWTQAGWAYAALLVDLCTRRIVGWAVSSSCDTNLALRALDQAEAPGLLHHTDRGSTYTADAYRERLRAHGMLCSMSRTGNSLQRRSHALRNQPVHEVGSTPQDSEVNRVKRWYLDEWVKAVNGHGGFETWTADVSFDPPDVHDILGRHETAQRRAD